MNKVNESIETMDKMNERVDDKRTWRQRITKMSER